MSKNENRVNKVIALFQYIQWLRADGQDLRMYQSVYENIPVFKQVSSRYSKSTGMSLNKKSNTIYFIESSKRNFKNLEDLLDYIDKH